jgi:hypothetical protein
MIFDGNYGKLLLIIKACDFIFVTDEKCNSTCFKEF